MLKIKFSSSDIKEAHELFGCNCGPAALAAATGATLQDACLAIPGFMKLSYTNVKMMKAGIENLDHGVGEVMRGNAKQTLQTKRDVNPAWLADLFSPANSLVLVQFGGSWIDRDGKPAPYAMRRTHWIATSRCEGRNWVFDVNLPLRLPLVDWVQFVVPRLIENVRGCDGTLWPRYVLKLRTLVRLRRC